MVPSNGCTRKVRSGLRSPDPSLPLPFLSHAPQMLASLARLLTLALCVAPLEALVVGVTPRGALARSSYLRMDAPPPPSSGSRLGGTVDQDGKSNVWAVEPTMKVDKTDKGVMAFAPVALIAGLAVLAVPLLPLLFASNPDQGEQRPYSFAADFILASFFSLSFCGARRSRRRRGAHASLFISPALLSPLPPPPLLSLPQRACCCCCRRPCARVPFPSLSLCRALRRTDVLRVVPVPAA